MAWVVRWIVVRQPDGEVIAYREDFEEKEKAIRTSRVSHPGGKIGYGAGDRKEDCYRLACALTDGLVGADWLQVARQFVAENLVQTAVGDRWELLACPFLRDLWAYIGGQLVELYGPEQAIERPLTPMECDGRDQ